MPTPGSIEAKLKAGLELRGMSTEQFAEVARLEGITNSSRRHLDRVFKDERTLDGGTAEKLWALWYQIENLQFWCYVVGLPFKIDLSDGAKVFEWLQVLRSRFQQEQQEAKQELNSDDSSNDSCPAQ